MNRDYAGDFPVKEEAVENPEIPVGPGYGESKWVSERILDAAAKKTSLKPVIVRLGQACGDTNSVWKESEWFPSLVKSAETMGCLPNMEGVSLDWLPRIASSR